MTPQSSFTIVAAIDTRHEAEVRSLLASMNVAPGCVNARNPLVRFGQYDTLHFARFVILDDRTLDDGKIYGLPRPAYPLYLVFLGDVDGDADVFLRSLAQRSSKGLRAIFSCCEGFTTASDLLAWIRERRVPCAAGYVNWKGRTVRAVREEAALYEALERRLQEHSASFVGKTPRETHTLLRAFVDEEVAAGGLILSPQSPTPLAWWLADVLHLFGVPLLLLVLLPLLLVVKVLFLIRLRRLEKTDPEICPRVETIRADELSLLEDHELTNQFTAMGSLKPGLVRAWITTFILWAVDYAARHVYTRGRLARVRSIHFARWVFLDGKKRLLFASNYDGSLESYMDDFINKVGFGLNLTFSNGIGYPRTNWLIFDGCKDERKFKDYLRRHQVPTQVWYNAHTGLTAVAMERNTRVRHGLEAVTMTDEQLFAWTALL